MEVVDTEIYDSVTADSLEEGDFIRYGDEDYEILHLDDETDLITVTVNPLDSVESDDTLILDPYEVVSLIQYV